MNQVPTTADVAPHPDVTVEPSGHAGGLSSVLLGEVLALPAALYAVGFIVVFTAEERLGLVSVTTEFFKTKYLHVGVICAAFIGIFAIPGYLLVAFGSRRSAASGDTRPQKTESPPPSLTAPLKFRLVYPLVVGPPIVGMYLRLTLAAPETFTPYGAAALGSYAVSLAMALVLRMRFDARRAAAVPATLRAPVLLRLAPVYVVGLGFVYLALELLAVPWGEWPRPGMFIVGAFFIGTMSTLIGMVASRLQMRARDQPRGNVRVGILMLGSALATFFLYVAVYGFGVCIYPYIAVNKGGGDFADAATATIYFVASESERVPQGLRAYGGQSIPVVVLLETSDNLYVAPDGPTRNQWGKPRAQKPSHIYRVSTKDILVVDSAPPVAPRPGVSSSAPPLGVGSARAE